MIRKVAILASAAFFAISASPQIGARNGEHSGEVRLAQYQSNDACFGCPSNGRQLCYFECDAEKQQEDSQCAEAWWLSERQKQICVQQNFESWRGCRRKCVQEYP